MAVNFSKTIQKAKINSGYRLFDQGEAVDGIILIHEGEVILSMKPDSTNGGQPEVQMNLWSLQDNMICGDSIVSTSGIAPFSAISSKESIISIFPLPRKSFAQTIGTKQSLGIMMARSLVRQVLSAIKKENDANLFLSQVQRFNDALGMALFKMDGLRFQEGNLSNKPSWFININDLINQFFSAGAVLPETIDEKFFQEDYSSFLKKKYGVSQHEATEEALFYKRFFSMPSNYQQKFFEGQGVLLKYVIGELANLLEEKVNNIKKIAGLLKDELSVMQNSQQSWFLEYISLFEKNQIENDPVKKAEVHQSLRYVISTMLSLQKKFTAIWGVSFSNADGRIQNILDQLLQNEKMAMKQEEQGSSPAINADISIESLIEGELKDSIQQIITYSGLENEKALKFYQLWGSFKEAKNRMDSESDMRKMRRQISKIYWEIYRKSFLKFVKTNQVPKPVDLMFNYGFLDEKILSPEHISVIYRYQDNTPSKYPVFTIKEWLMRVYQEQDNPSITELGQSYREILRQELRGVENVNLHKTERFPNDKSDKRVEFEIEHMLSNGCINVAGSIGSAFPILIEDLVSGKVKDLFIQKKVIQDTVDEWLDVDWSLFYREVLYKENNSSRDINEFVRLEVLPIFILLPSVGQRATMWQEMDGKDKTSPSRFLIPTLAIGQLREMLVEAFGVFRWEIVRNIAGAGWADASANILTSDYFDYQEFYKKNSHLSAETKEKIKAEFRKFRDPRSRFVNDYKNWIMFEKEGIPKLNKVARDLFIRHVPFKKERRQQLMSFPAFNGPLTRYDNVNARKKRELENRYFKYTKSGISMPEKLQHNLELFDR